MRSLSIVIQLIVIAVYSRADCSNDQSFAITPVSVIVNVSDIVHLPCRILDEQNRTFFGQGWEFFIHNDSSIDPHLQFGNLFGEASSTGSYNYSIVSMNGGYLEIDTVSVFHHGYYRCTSSCIMSPIVSLTVMGKILVNFTDQSYDDTLSTGDNFQKEVVILGAPEPEITLEKLTGEFYEEVIDDDRIQFTSTILSISNLLRSDSGEYRITTTNSFGTTYREFVLTVTGVDQPIISLSRPKQEVIEIPIYSDELSSQISIECSIPESAYDATDEMFSLQWVYEGNAVSFETGAYVRQMLSDSMLAVTLIISGFEEGNNGKYTCQANNSNSESTSFISVIGPPSSIDPENVVNVEDKQITISWDKPESFTRDIHYYEIQYRYSNDRSVRETNTVNVSADTTSWTFDIKCPNAQWTFSIIAFNDLGLSSASSEMTIDLSSVCDLEPRTTTTTTTGTPVRTSTTISSTVGPVTTNENPVTVPIVAGAIGGALLLISCIAILVVFAVCFVTSSRRKANMSHERRWNQQEETTDYNSPQSSLTKSSLPMLNGIPSPLPATPGYGPVYIDPQFEFPRENLNLTDILYDGTFTVIYKATALGIKENKSIEVAVKSIKDEYLEMDDYVSTLILEIEQLGQLGKHPNVVSLLKVCTVGRPVYMVTEYMCHGDLLGFLRSTRKHTDMYTVFPGTKNLPTHLKLTSRDLLHIITQIVNGMIFLSEKKVVHGALCARNVLVGTSMEVKIFNIGVQNLDNDESVDSLVRWMAPEVFLDGVRTMYGDVWSFGILMWEVITVGGTPYAEINLQDLYQQLVSGIRLNCPAHCAQSLYDIMRLCWEYIPQHRPLFSEIHDHLDNLKISKTSYLDLRSYNDLAYSQFEDSERQLTSNL